MITELSIEGFKSFGSPQQKLKLNPLNFIVGANASGKSNLISALRFLQFAVKQDTEFAIRELGGVAEVRNKILREKVKSKFVNISLRLISQRNGIEVGFEKSRFIFKEFSYSINLDLRHESGVPVVVHENIKATILDSKFNTKNFQLERTRDEVILKDETADRENRERKLKVPESESSRLALGVGFFSLPLIVLKNIIVGWRFYNISPLLAREPSKETPEIDLGYFGENLAVVLHRLEQNNGKNGIESIVANLKGVVPGFKNVKTTPLPFEGKWAFQIVEDRIQGKISSYAASDGTIRLLALLVITSWVTRNSSLIVIEEPENGLHPHLSEHIVNIFRTASEKQQVMVTTHNPTFLDHLNPEEIILCDKVNGFTKLRHASDISQIKSFQKNFRLGELWVQGTLGGIP